MELNDKYEQIAWSKDHLILGLDEVGMGSLSGPIVTCGVILNRNFKNEMVTDSKKLTHSNRVLLDKYIRSNSVAIFIEVSDVKSIETLNPQGANRAAMAKIIDDSKDYKLEHILIDWVKINDERVISKPKGESWSVSIAAASIVAKVFRDNLMLELSNLFPNYKWDKNKGYGTKQHYDALAKYGKTIHHRSNYRLFAKDKKTNK